MTQVSYSLVPKEFALREASSNLRFTRKISDMKTFMIVTKKKQMQIRLYNEDLETQDDIQKRGVLMALGRFPLQDTSNGVRLGHGTGDAAFGNIVVWLGIEGGGFITWGIYEDLKFLHRDWEVLYEFRHVLTEKTIRIKHSQWRQTQ